MKSWSQHKSFLCYEKQQIFTYGNPYLCENCIHRGTIEGFNMKVLFYPFEKQFNLPSFPIQIGDCEHLQLEVVKQESIHDTGTEIFIYDEPESVGVLAGGFYGRQSYLLIRDQACIRVNFSPVSNESDYKNINEHIDKQLEINLNYVFTYECIYEY